MSDESIESAAGFVAWSAAGANLSIRSHVSYPLGLEDYRNDLELRGILRQARAEGEEAEALDQRLKAMLAPAK
jgi:hypothetical protein